MTRWERAPQRVWSAHVLAGGGVVLAVVGGVVGAGISSSALYPACEADYSEDTIVAPASYRGRLMCNVASDGSLSDSVFVLFGLMAAPVLLALGGLVAWVVFKKFARLLPVLVVALLLPWVICGAVLAVPADCTAAQREDHGASGCERNEEVRHGIGSYDT